MPISQPVRPQCYLCEAMDAGTGQLWAPPDRPDTATAHPPAQDREKRPAQPDALAIVRPSSLSQFTISTLVSYHRPGAAAVGGRGGLGGAAVLDEL